MPAKKDTVKGMTCFFAITIIWTTIRQGTYHAHCRPWTTSAMRRSLAFCALVCGLWFTAGLFAPSVMASSEIRYDVTMEGMTNKLRTRLEEISKTVLLEKKRPPGSIALLRRRVNEDIPRLLQVLKGEGYYGARVSADIDTKAEPVRVMFRVALGPSYLLKSVEIKTVDQDARPRVSLPNPEELGLHIEKPARARAVLDAKEELIKHTRKQGFPFPRIVQQKVIVDHAERTLAVIFSLDTGPLAHFGSTSIIGLESIDESVVRSEIPWQDGDRFGPEMFSQLEKELIKTGLFATVQVKLGETFGKDGLLPVTITVKERKHRTISAAASYKTDEGLGGTISWEHRNLLHYGDRLRLTTTASEITLAAEGQFRKQQFLRDDQSLSFTLRAADDRPDAFRSLNVYTSLILDRTLPNEMVLGGGLAFKAEWVEQLGDENRYGLASVPLHLYWDTSDDLLDPKRGGRLMLALAPYYDAFGSNLSFIKGQLGYSRYTQVFTKPSLVLAGRVNVGSIGGAKRDEIPADERFYAGGGGSIRGYPFQSAGPLDGTNPIGGRSSLELSAELRLKIGEHIGFVAFLDGGNAFTDSIGDSGENLLWGTGAGFRYFTAIGPVRLDIGVPLNQRKGIDDDYQIYLSFGQAF